MLIECLRCGRWPGTLAILDVDPAKAGQQVAGVPVLGTDELLPGLVERGARWFAVGVGSAPDTGPRAGLYEQGLRHGLTPLTVIHPSAIVSERATLGRGAQVMPGGIVNPGAVLGENVIVNSGAIIEHDCALGDHVHVATGARLGGTVRVGSRAHVGLGATVRQGVVIGERAVVGAGAVVVRDVPPGVVVAGVPARELRVAS